VSYKSLVDKSLLMAFRQAKDLAVDIVLRSSTGNSFDFTTATASRTSLPDLPGKAIIVKERTLKDGSLARKLLIKAEAVSLYDTVLFDDVPWKVGEFIQSNKHTTMVEVFQDV